MDAGSTRHPNLTGYRIIIATAVGILLSTACATTSVYQGWGVTEKRAVSVNRILQTGDDLLFEFTLEKSATPVQFVWARISREDLFSGQRNDALKWDLSKGALPEKEVSSASPLLACITYSTLGQLSISMRDACGEGVRLTTVYFMGRFVTRRAPWRPVVLPVVLPLTFVYDIVSFPFSLVYFMCAPDR